MQQTELIKIEAREISGAIVQTTNARELHAFLEVGRDFSNWIKDRIEQYGFVENRDFVCSSKLASKGRGGHNAKEYHLTLGMGKELAMVERNEKGKQARLYFLECERRAKAAPVLNLDDPAAVRGLLLTYCDKVIALEEKLSVSEPKAEAFSLVSSSPGTLTITEAAKVLGVQRKLLVALLLGERWVFRQNGSLVGYKPHIDNGNLHYKEAKYRNELTLDTNYKAYCHITQKGITELALLLTAA